MFYAHIIWLCPDHPSLHLETVHAGFPSADAAALFANGFVQTAPELLHVGPEGARMEFLNSCDLPLAEAASQIYLWRTQDAGLCDESSSTALLLTPASPATLDIAGRYVPGGHAVTGPSGPVSTHFTLDARSGFRAMTDPAGCSDAEADEP